MSAVALLSTENLPYEKWLEARKKGIGGSDASVACGISRYKSPVELWMANFHLEIGIISRSKGRSIASTIGYASRSTIHSGYGAFPLRTAQASNLDVSAGQAIRSD